MSTEEKRRCTCTSCGLLFTVRAECTVPELKNDPVGYVRERITFDYVTAAQDTSVAMVPREDIFGTDKTVPLTNQEYNALYKYMEDYYSDNGEVSYPTTTKHYTQTVHPDIYTPRCDLLWNPEAHVGSTKDHPLEHIIIDKCETRNRADKVRVCLGAFQQQNLRSRTQHALNTHRHRARLHRHRPSPSPITRPNK